MREIRPSGSEGGARFYPLSLPLSVSSATESESFGQHQPRSPNATPDMLLSVISRFSASMETPF